MTEQTSQQVIEPVRHEVTVPLLPDAAFKLFTADVNSWWPGHHIGGADLQAAIIESRAGGRFYEKDADGSECDWGQVLVFDPPGRLVLRWRLNGEFSYDPDPEHGSEVEVTFMPDGATSTRVRLEHRHFERHGSTGAALRQGVADGWGEILRGYAKLAVG